MSSFLPALEARRGLVYGLVLVAAVGGPERGGEGRTRFADAPLELPDELLVAGDEEAALVVCDRLCVESGFRDRARVGDVPRLELALVGPQVEDEEDGDDEGDREDAEEDSDRRVDVRLPRTPPARPATGPLGAGPTLRKPVV